MLLFVAIMFGAVSTAAAWDRLGHKVAAFIAWENMEPEAREKVHRLLLAAPEDSHLSIAYDAFDRRSEAV